MANENEHHTINDTGIYQMETVCVIRDGEVVPGGREAAEAIFKAHNRSLDLDALLADLRRLGLAVLDGHTTRMDSWVAENGEVKGIPHEVPSTKYPYRIGSNAPPMAQDAAKMMLELDAATAALQCGDIRKFGLHMYGVGALSDRIYVRQFEGAAKIAKGKGKAYRWRGTWLRVTLKERLILEAMVTTNELLLDDLVRRVWKRTYHADYRGTYDQALSRLNRKITEAGLPIQLHVRDDRVIVA